SVLVEVGATVDVGTVLATINTDDQPGQPHVAEDEQPAPPVSPVVRRIADEHHIDLAQVKGSGRRGRVTKKDVLGFVENGERPLHIESPYVEDEPAAPAAGDPLSVMRRRIGEHMRQSLDTAAH